jgi:hypothetical protein
VDLQGFYPAGDGSCDSCPVLSGSTFERYSGLFQLLGAVIGSALLVAGALIVLVRCVGGTLAGTATLAMGLVQWAIVAVQTVSQASGPASSYSLPPLLEDLFRSLQALQIQGLIVPPACNGSYAFTTEVAVCGIAVFLALVVLVLYYAAGRESKIRIAGRVSLMLVLILYPACVRNAVSLLFCTPVVMNAAITPTLDGGGGKGGGGRRNDVVSLNILASNPAYVCWSQSGSHLPAGIVAVIALFIVGVGLPSFVLVWIRSAVRQRQPPLLQVQNRSMSSTSSIALKDTRSLLSFVNPLSSSREYKPSSTELPDVVTAVVEPAPHAECSLDPILAPFLGDYRHSVLYMRHLDVALALLLATLEALLSRPPTLTLAIVKAACISITTLALCVHVLATRPFAPDHSWKGPVRAMVLALAAGCAIMNAGIAAVDLGYVDDRLKTAMNVGAYLLLALFAATIFLLVLSVGRAMYTGARLEQSTLESRLAAATRTGMLVGRSTRRDLAGENDPILSSGAGDTNVASSPGGGNLSFSNPLRDHLRGDAGIHDGEATSADTSSLNLGTRSHIQHLEATGGRHEFAAVPVSQFGNHKLRSSSRSHRRPPRAVRAYCKVLESSTAADPDALSAACDAIAMMPPSEARAASVILLPALSGCAMRVMEEEVDSTSKVAVVSQLIRTLAAVTEHCAGGSGVESIAAGGFPGLLIAVLQSPDNEFGVQTLAQTCWLIGNVAHVPEFSTAFVEIGGAQALTSVLQRCAQTIISPPVFPFSSSVAATVDMIDLPLQCIIAVSGIAELPAGAAALTSAGVVACASSILAAHDSFHIGVVVACCKVLDMLLYGDFTAGHGLRDDQCVRDDVLSGAAAAEESSFRLAACSDLLLCGGLAAMIGVMASRRALEDEDITWHLARALFGAVTVVGGVGEQALAAAAELHADSVISGLMRAHVAATTDSFSGSRAAVASLSNESSIFVSARQDNDLLGLLRATAAACSSKQPLPGRTFRRSQV